MYIFSLIVGFGLIMFIAGVFKLASSAPEEPLSKGVIMGSLLEKYFIVEDKESYISKDGFYRIFKEENEMWSILPTSKDYNKIYVQVYYNRGLSINDFRNQSIDTCVGHYLELKKLIN